MTLRRRLFVAVAALGVAVIGISSASGAGAAGATSVSGSLGATGAGAKDFHNCASWQDGLTKEGIMGAWPVYLYLDLVKEAEDYVKANPYVAPVIKKSIICKKGKKKRFVTSDNPKCPKGYKKK